MVIKDQKYYIEQKIKYFGGLKNLILAGEEEIPYSLEEIEKEIAILTNLLEML